MPASPRGGELYHTRGFLHTAAEFHIAVLVMVSRLWHGSFVSSRNGFSQYLPTLED